MGVKSLEKDELLLRIFVAEPVCEYHRSVIQCLAAPLERAISVWTSELVESGEPWAN